RAAFRSRLAPLHYARTGSGASAEENACRCVRWAKARTTEIFRTITIACTSCPRGQAELRAHGVARSACADFACMRAFAHPTPHRSGGALEDAAPVEAVNRAPGVFVFFSSAQEMKLARANAPAFRDDMAQQQRARAFERQCGIEACEVVIGAAPIDKAVVHGREFIGDTQRMEAYDSFRIQPGNSRAMERNHARVAQHSWLIPLLPTRAVKLDEGCKQRAGRDLVHADKLDKPFAHGAVARKSEMLLFARGQPWGPSVRGGCEIEHRAGAGRFVAHASFRETAECERRRAGHQLVEVDAPPISMRRKRTEKRIACARLEVRIDQYVDIVADA